MKTINIDGVKYVSEKDYQELSKKKTVVKTINGMETPFEVGEKYFIRTVTYFATGEVESIKGSFIVLKTAAWIADTGRFADAMKSGEFSEVEPVLVPMIINLNSIIDSFVWTHALPVSQK